MPPAELMEDLKSPSNYTLQEGALLSDIARQHAMEMIGMREMHARAQALQDWIGRMHRLYGAP